MPETTVAAIITKRIDERECILLALRDHEPFKGFWGIPGGHIEKQESVHDAVVREVNEETGLMFKGNFFSFFEEYIPQLHIANIVLVFAGEAEGNLPDRTEEVADFMWLPPMETLKLQLAFRHDAIIREYMNRANMKPD